MLNLPAQGLKAQVAKWFSRLPQFREWFSSSLDVYGDLLGVDLDDSSIASILLHHTLGVARVSRADVVALSAGAIIEDAIVENTVVASAVKKMLEQARIHTGNAVLAMPGSKVVVKQIQLNTKLNDTEAEARAWSEARRTFPDIVKNLYLDFTQIEEPSIDKNKKIILVIVAVRKEDIMPRVETLHQAGLITKIVDVDYFAIERAYSLLASQLPEDHAGKYVAIIDFNPHSLLLVVMHKKQMIYYNRQSYTGDALVPMVQKAMGVTISGPVKNKPVVLPSLHASMMQTESPTPISTTGLTDEQQSHTVMSIRRLFQSFYAENTGKVINHIVMTGRCALLTDLMQHIEKTIDIPTTVGNPLLSLKMSERLNTERLLKLGPAFTLCCGLAMRGIPL